jgi:hypothetical protein
VGPLLAFAAAALSEGSATWDERSITARVDIAAGVARVATCVRGPCALVSTAKTVKVDLPNAAEVRDVSVRGVLLAPGRSVLHVRASTVIGGGSGATWEALFVPTSIEPLFTGTTGLGQGDPGERSGTVVRMLPRGDGTFAVVVATLREDVHLCGEGRASTGSAEAETLLAPRAVDAETGTLRPYALDRLGAKARASATAVEATALRSPPPPPRAALLSPGSSSAEDDPAPFVTYRAAPEVPIERFVLTPAPLSPLRVPLLVTPDAAYAVHLPKVSRGATSVEVRLPQPVRAPCVALVWAPPEEASKASKPAALAVPPIGVVAYAPADLEARPLVELVDRLDAGDDAAAVMLRRSGSHAATAIADRFDALGGRGRATALDLTEATGGCAQAGPLAARAIDDTGEVARHADAVLERCANDALPALDTALGRGSPRARAAVRRAIARAARGRKPEELATLLRKERTEEARLDLYRALSSELGRLPGDVRAGLYALERSPSMAMRYLALEPLAQLARAGDATAARALADGLVRDVDPIVRTRAADLAATVPALRADVATAAGDAHPRVREAALRAMATGGAADDASALAAAHRLATDEPWTFVRVQAARALAGSAPAGKPTAAKKVQRALLAALDDPSPHVRTEAAHALGARCDRAALDALADRAREGANPTSAESPDVALAALAAAARIDPVAARKAAAPLVGKNASPELRAGAEAALRGAGACARTPAR